jgi:hypothetical protein
MNCYHHQQPLSGNEKYLLTICVRSLKTRQNFLAAFLAMVVPQITDGVELIVLCDDGEISSGAKCQRMLEMSQGRFVVWLDDDDEISPVYVDLVLDAIRRVPNAHYIGYLFTRSIDGNEQCLWNVPMPLHITPVRRELAIKVGFPDKNAGDDSDYSQGLRALGVDQGEIIDAPLYHYAFRSSREGEKRNEPFVAHERKSV